jgi:hypothetical protein
MVLGLALAGGTFAVLEPGAAGAMASAAVARLERMTGVRFGDIGESTQWDPSRVAGGGAGSGPSTAPTGSPASPSTPRAAALPVESSADLGPTSGRRHSYEVLAARLRRKDESGLRRTAYDSSPGAVGVTQSFRFQGRRQSVAFTVSRQDLDWSRGRQLTGILVPGESRRDFSSRLWRQAVADEHQSGLYDSLAGSLRRLRRELDLGRDEYAELIATYVQEMPYDTAAARQGVSTRYPIVTAVDGKGVCADRSLLMAGLLQHEGYRVVLMDFQPESHMAVGLKVDGGGYRGTGYAFVESTGLSLVGEVGKGYGPSGSVKLTSTPHVTSLGSSGSSYRAANETAFVLDRAASAERAYSLYRTQLRGLESDPARYNVVVAQVNRYADELNTASRHADDREALYVWMRARAAEDAQPIR